MSNKLDISKVSDDNVIAINGRAWIKAEVSEKFYNINNTPCLVVKISDGCFTGKSTSASLGGGVSDTLGFASVANNVSIDPSAQTAVDAQSINDRGDQPAAVLPVAVAVPMRSNIYVYGPYASSNFSSNYGGTTVEHNQDLAPWLFGSTQAMNQAGNAIAQTTSIGL